MSIDPLGLDASLVQAALNLGVSIELLQSQIAVGDMLAATVLPPQNGQDLIQVLGQTVVAQLPPTVTPGETIVLQVTGFAGNQILVQNLGAYDPQNPVPLSRAVLPPELPPQTATLTTIRPATPNPSTPSRPSSVPPASVRVTAAPIAPPPAVFAAASVVRPQAPQTQAASIAARSVATRVPNEVDARIATAKSALIQSEPVPSAVRASSVPRPDQKPIVLPPPSIVQRAVVQSLRTISDVLKAAGLGNSTMSRTAAVIAPQAPQRLLPVLERLDKALPEESADPRVSTVRTIIGFVSRLNLNNPETLPSQIAAYVSHVVEGAEAKLQQLLAAYVRAQPQSAAMEQQPGNAVAQNGSAAAPPTNSAAEASAAGDPASPLHGDRTPLPSQAGQSAAAAQVAERAASAEHDLKTLVLSLLRSPLTGAPNTTTLTQALNETVITLTGTQLNVISANLDNPSALTIPLPAFFHEGGKPAYLRIERDSNGSSVPLDGDDFHVSFILDTANLGTVAVDLQSAGRTVKVDVKTERASAAGSFSKTLDKLRARLETLNYRVASARASAVAPAESSPLRPDASRHADGPRRAEAAKSNGTDDVKRNVDLQA